MLKQDVQLKRYEFHKAEIEVMKIRWKVITQTYKGNTLKNMEVIYQQILKESMKKKLIALIQYYKLTKKYPA